MLLDGVTRSGAEELTVFKVVVRVDLERSEELAWLWANTFKIVKVVRLHIEHVERVDVVCTAVTVAGVDGHPKCAL